MNISRLEAKNIKGFESFEIDPGAVTVVSGHNASNKTSLLSLVVGLFGKGNPRMLRVGAESGHIRAVLQEGAETWEIKREFTPGKAQAPKVKASRGGTMGAGVDFLKSLIDPVSVDPINRAMNATEEEQTRILLETMSLDLDHAQLYSAVQELDLPNLPALLKGAQKMQALDAIKAIEDYVYAERTTVNRDEKLKRAHARELLSALPRDVEDRDWAATVKTVEQELAALVKAEREEVRAEESRHSADKLESAGMAMDAKEAIDAEIDGDVKALQDQIAALERKRSEKKQHVSDILAGEINRMAEENNLTIAAIGLKYRSKMEACAAQKAEASTRASDQTRVSEVKRISADASKAAESLGKRSQAMTVALKAVDNVRAALLEKLPIKGLLVQNGVVYLDGVPLSEKNTAERVLFWIRVAVMRAGELGIICVDGSECLDEQTFDKAIEGMRRTGVQWFVGRVTSGDFKVETLEALE